MSEKDKSTVPEVIDIFRSTDLSEESMRKVQKYMDTGLPGISSVDEQKIAKMTELYLGGKTYDQISNITRISKVMVMYLSYKLNWCETRKEYTVELNDHIKRRIMESKLRSQDFILQYIQMLEKKIGHKISRYMATDNEEFTDQISAKDVDRYMKAVELLHKTTTETKEKGPLIGLNLSDGATVTRKNDNEIEITPKQKAIGDVLKHYADLRREEEKK